MNNFKKLLSFDKIRIYKIIEIFQFAIIYLFAALLLSHVFDKIFKYDIDLLKQKSRIVLYLESMLIAFLYSIVTYYVIKISKLFSIVPFFDKTFIAGTTLKYTVETIFVVFFIKINKCLYNRLKVLELIN